MDLESCRLLLIVNSTVNSGATTHVFSNVNGTVGGPAAAGIPAESQATATCTVSTTQYAHLEGATISGTFEVKLVTSSNPAGIETSIDFEGTWS